MMRKQLLMFIVIFWSFYCHAQTAFEYYNIALVKYNLNDYKGAISDLDKAIEIDPEYAVAHILRGAAKYQTGDFQGAVDDNTRAMEIDPRYSRATRLRISDDRGVISDIDSGVQVDPRFAIAYYNRGLARLQLGDNAGSFADHTRALVIDPELFKAYHYMGMAKFRLGDYTEACNLWRKAVDHGHEESYELLMDLCKFI